MKQVLTGNWPSNKNEQDQPDDREQRILRHGEG
jgi:hypothetical protein